jgi:hypothetical protein
LEGVKLWVEGQEEGEPAAPRRQEEELLLKLLRRQVEKAVA